VLLVGIQVPVDCPESLDGSLGSVVPKFTEVFREMGVWSQACGAFVSGCVVIRGEMTWMPRRGYYEFFRLATAQDLQAIPDAWEAWFMAHPNLVWDEKQMRLVDR
jgi:hypothetical protein